MTGLALLAPAAILATTGEGTPERWASCSSVSLRSEHNGSSLTGVLLPSGA
ncbi:MAG TPA: hypothetical protein VNK05_19455 [Chloroflexota bacterium]|nr:hypothetical protein [Chloroflexota bacterium]